MSIQVIYRYEGEATFNIEDLYDYLFSLLM